MKKIIAAPLIILLTAGFIFCLTQSSIAAEKDKYGGIFRLNIAKGNQGFGDPLKARGGAFNYNDFVLQALFELSYEKVGELRPELATSWELAPDKSHYIFHLRKGVKFHDGTDFNAQAAKWNLDRWINAKMAQVANLKSVDILDEYTIRVNLKKWDHATMHSFRNNVEMISPTAFEKHGAKWAMNNPVGTGPFKLVEFKRSLISKYERFDDYWEKGLPYLDGIIITNVTDPMTVAAMMKRGEIDAWSAVDAISAAEIKKSGEYVVQTGPGPHEVLSFNSKDPESPWSDKRMRMAAEYAIDKEAIADAVGLGFRPANYNIIQGLPPYPEKKPRKYNPDKARQLIKEAGYEGITVVCIHNAAPEYKNIGAALQRYFADVGINLIPKVMQTGPMTQKLWGGGLKGSEIIIGPAMGSAPEVFMWANNLYQSKTMWFKNSAKPKGYEELLNKALTAETREQGIKYLQQLDKLFYDYGMVIPFISSELPIVTRPYVKDLNWWSGGGVNRKIRHMWLDKKK